MEKATETLWSHGLQLGFPSQNIRASEGKDTPFPQQVGAPPGGGPSRYTEMEQSFREKKLNAVAAGKS